MNTQITLNTHIEVPRKVVEECTTVLELKELAIELVLAMTEVEMVDFICAEVEYKLRSGNVKDYKLV